MTIHKSQRLNNKQIDWIHEAYCDAKNYSIFLKPSIVKGKDLISSEEESISFPFLKFTIQRYNTITVQYLSEENIKVEEKIEGSLAHAFQQSYQQLNGEVLIDRRTNQGRMSFSD